MSKLNPDLNEFLQSTYLGGSGNDHATSIAVSFTNDYIYVVGETSSTNFSAVAGGPQLSNAGGVDAFVSVFNPDLRSIYRSTYLGGSGDDAATSIAIDSAGNIYVAGHTSSADFPGTAGGAQSSLGGGKDAFVSKINPSLTSLLQSTYLGGSGDDVASSIALDSAGDAYVAGSTTSTDFPGIAGGAQPSPGGMDDAFVAKFDSSLTDGGTKIPTLTVLRSGTGTGTVTSSPSGIDCGSDCSESYNQGTSVTLTATPASGSIFGGWSGGGCSGTGSCSITMNSNQTITATFNQQPQHTLTVTKSGTGGGTVTSSPAGINCGDDCSESYSKVQKVKLTAKGDASSTFAGWSGGGCSGTKTCTVMVDTVVTVTADFALKIPDISVAQTPVEFGSIKVGKKGTKTLKIGNNGTGDLSITLSVLEGTNFSIQGSSSVTIRGKRSYTLKVLFTPKSPGLKTATLRITSNDPDTTTLDLPLSGIGGS